MGDVHSSLTCLTRAVTALEAVTGAEREQIRVVQFENLALLENENLKPKAAIPHYIRPMESLNPGFLGTSPI